MGRENYLLVHPPRRIPNNLLLGNNKSKIIHTDINIAQHLHTTGKRGK
jgi:hypothetical protein